jgi:YggT family protein
VPDIGCLIADLLFFYVLILFVRIILSWVTMFKAPSPAFAPVIRLIYDVTEPVLGFARRLIPPIGGLDLSPILIFFLISILRQVIC